MKSRRERLRDRTCAIIDRDGIILLKRGPWYLGQWTNVAAGREGEDWGWRHGALGFSDLEIAFAVAPVYDAKVVVFYPRGKKS